jgi:hypothetical protein
MMEYDRAMPAAPRSGSDMNDIPRIIFSMTDIIPAAKGRGICLANMHVS